MAKVYQRYTQQPRYQPPPGWRRIRTIDMHTGGEPLRVIVEGFPELKSEGVLAYRRRLREHHDDLRRALMLEPRGHADMYGCLLTPPNDETGDFGILFMHNEGYSTMCGHAVIAVIRLAIEMGWTEVSEPEVRLRIDAPCGRIDGFARLRAGEVEEMYFHGVPSFTLALDQEVETPDLGKLHYDLAYGGAFYAYVHAGEMNLELTPDNYSRIVAAGRAIKAAVQRSGAKTVHPFEPDLSFLYGVIFIADSDTPGVHSRNVCVFADGEVDRSPTGSGVMGRLAIHHARGEIESGEVLRIESIVGSVFSGSVVEEVTYGPHQAVVPRVGGSAYITGQHEFLIDPDDPLKEGFLLR